MSYRLSLGEKAEEWLYNEAHVAVRFPVALWLADLCEDPEEVGYTPVPGLMLAVRSAFVDTLPRASILVTYTVFHDVEVVRVHKIVGNWQVPMM